MPSALLLSAQAFVTETVTVVPSPVKVFTKPPATSVVA